MYLIHIEDKSHKVDVPHWLTTDTRHGVTLIFNCTEKDALGIRYDGDNYNLEGKTLKEGLKTATVEPYEPISQEYPTPEGEVTGEEFMQMMEEVL